MFSTQCNEFIFLDISPEMRAHVGQTLRASAFALMAENGQAVRTTPGSDGSLPVPEVEQAIDWLLPRVNQALDSAGLDHTFPCQLRQLLHATSSTKAITAEATCRVLNLDLQRLGKLP